ncbi:MAG: flavin reductase family protein [Candidatus Micrarchaeota archaeon]|nr:flavin reductase family protein [Candidatus Micrarchaeota archaeon]
MFGEIFYPRQVVLVTAATSEKSNVTAVEWFMPVAQKPPILAISLSNSSLTLDLICTSLEFAVAVPTEKMKEQVLLCGMTSGKFIDKFAETKISTMKAKKISAPLIADAAANLECKVRYYSTQGDYTIVLGEVVEAHFSKSSDEPLLFNKGGKELFGLKKDQL